MKKGAAIKVGAALLCALAVLASCSRDAGVDGLEGKRICGSRSILGETAETIPGRVRGCGLKDGVRVFSVAGVRLSSPATVDCATAQALDSWVTDSVKPAFRKQGGGVSELWVMASYTCRPRNGIPGARISEHGRGKAVDIGGFRMADGSMVTVLTGWRSKSSSKILQSVHKDACGPFGTVLGPRSDVFHQNHFHLDTADYRSGPYCR